MFRIIDILVTPKIIFYTGLFLIALGSLHVVVVKRRKNNVNINEAS